MPITATRMNTIEEGVSINRAALMTIDGDVDVMKDQIN